MEPGKPLAVGSAHGRFQPPHKGHLEYLLAAKKLCSYLWIGITQYDITHLIQSDLAVHRGQISANPLTYFERMQLISKMLNAAGVNEGQFGFVPFPIETPGALVQFLPTTITCFTTVYDEWNKEKIKLLQSQGYKVEVLWERDVKTYAGKAVRETIKNGDSNWKQLIPEALHEEIEKLGFRERLNSIGG